MSVRLRLAENAGKNLGDALVDGARNGFSNIREFIQKVRNDPMSFVSDRSGSSSKLGFRDYLVIELTTAYVWWQFVLDDDQSYGVLDIIAVSYVASVIYGVLR